MIFLQCCRKWKWLSRKRRSANRHRPAPQVASFRTASDADALKARLALLGMVAKIQEVTVNDATWHRVRLGPYDSAREVNRLQITLRDNNIDSRVYKDQ
jgi:cell division protein FtsN